MSGRLYTYFAQAGAGQDDMTLVDGAHFSNPGRDGEYGWLKDELTKDIRYLGEDGGVLLHTQAGVHYDASDDQKAYDVSNFNVITPHRRAMARDLNVHALNLCGGDGRRVVNYVGGFHWGIWRERLFDDMERAYYRALWCVPASCDLGFDALTKVKPGSKAWRLVTQKTYRRSITRWGEPFPHPEQEQAWRDAGLGVIETSMNWTKQRRLWFHRHLLIAHNDVAALSKAGRVKWVKARLAEGYDVACPVGRWFREAGLTNTALR